MTVTRTGSIRIFVAAAGLVYCAIASGYAALTRPTPFAFVSVCPRRVDQSWDGGGHQQNCLKDQRAILKFLRVLCVSEVSFQVFQVNLSPGFDHVLG